MPRTLCYAAIVLAALIANSAQGHSATLILLNGKIWTENPKQPESEAVAIEGNLILSVGSSAAIRKLAGPDCQIVDLGGRRVVPGSETATGIISAGRRRRCRRMQRSTRSLRTIPCLYGVRTAIWPSPTPWP